jgi:hypothetical protein
MVDARFERLVTRVSKKQGLGCAIRVSKALVGKE